MLDFRFKVYALTASVILTITSAAVFGANACQAPSGCVAVPRQLKKRLRLTKKNIQSGQIVEVANDASTVGPGPDGSSIKLPMDFLAVHGEGGAFSGGFGVRPGGQLMIVRGPKRANGGPNLARVKVLENGFEGNVFWIDLIRSTFIVEPGKSATAKNLARRTLPAKESIPAVNGKVKIAFFDADGTLRISSSKKVSANGPRDVAILPNVSEKIAELTADNYLIVVVSNQGGVKFGYITIEDADSALTHTVDLIRAQNPQALFRYYDFAEGGSSDENTKPKIGMAKRLEELLKQMNLQVDWTESFMVGDAAKKTKDFSDSDRVFAENLGIKFIYAKDFFGWTDEQFKAIRNFDLDYIRISTCAELLASPAP